MSGANQPKAYLLARREWFPLGGRVHRLWWHLTDKAWWAIGLCRPLCWINDGHTDDSYGRCVICGVALDGGPG